MFFSANIRAIKSRRMREVVHVACMETMKYESGNLKGRHNLGYLGVLVRLILKLILNNRLSAYGFN
jgi:hypothetical protein